MKILFIGLKYHLKTKSSDFFIKILEEKFEVDYLWIQQGENDSDIVDLYHIDYAAVIIWQHIPNPEDVSLFKTKNIIFIPMYDATGVYFNNNAFNPSRWFGYRNYKFINFSSTLHENMKKIGINSLHIQYSPNLVSSQYQQHFRKKAKVFFWQRRNEINWTTIKKILKPEQVDSFHLHKAIDPNVKFEMPSKEDVNLYNITFSDWYETKDEYLKEVSKCDVYISPRLFEGIGMSFLEAMMMGKCVIAPDYPTMNEYLDNYETGILFDYKNLKPVDISDFEKIGKNAHLKLKSIHKQWLEKEKTLIDFILSEPAVITSDKDIIYQKLLTSIHNMCSYHALKHPLKKIGAYLEMLDNYKCFKDSLSVQEKKKELPEKPTRKVKRILIFFPHNPFLCQNGIQSRFYALLEYFKSRNITVDILSHSNFVDVWKESDLSNHDLVNKVFLNDFQESKLKDKTVKNDTPLQDFGFDALKAQIESVFQENNYDIILMSYVHWAKILKDITGVKKMIAIEDFISLNNYERQNGSYNLGESINEEIRRINDFDTAICISKEEMNFFERVCKTTRFVYIPHFLTDQKKMDNTKKIDIVFIGSDNPFNKEGMIWFLEKVYPLLNEQFSIMVVGKVNHHLKSYKRTHKNINFVEYIKNIEDVYKSARLSICPLRGGTGLKIKVVESLSFSVPVVTTKYGLLDLDSSNNGCLEANNAKEFAKHIKQILQDRKQYEQLSHQAYSYFCNHFSQKIVYKKLDALFVDGKI